MKEFWWQVKLFQHKSASWQTDTHFDSNTAPWFTSSCTHHLISVPVFTLFICHSLSLSFQT